MEESKTHASPVSVSWIKLQVITHLKDAQEKFKRLPKNLQIATIGGAIVLLYLIVRLAGGSSEEIVSDSPVANEVKRKARTVNRTVHPINSKLSALSFAEMTQPFEQSGKSVICPDYKGNKGNRRCGKAFAEYRFDVTSAGTYYLYVETLATNIMDNSLWISPPLDDDGKPLEKGTSSYMKCPKGKPGPIVPHKHVSGSKYLCCPKYLNKNKKKGLIPYYSDCCVDMLGQDKNENGCVLDLEVSDNPFWQMHTREYKMDGNDPLIVRLYAREDGTAITGLYVSKDSTLTGADLS